MHKALLAFALSIVCAQAGLSDLEAISMIESGNNDRAIGSSGEVSRYQIMPRVWRSYTSSQAYQNEGVATEIARRHVAYLDNYFRRQTGRTPSAFDLYVMWNAGPTYYARIGFSARRVHPVIRERANRYVNLREMPSPAPASNGILALGGM